MTNNFYLNELESGKQTRSYIIVVNADDCLVRRLFLTAPYQGGSHDPPMYEALQKKWLDLSNEYSEPIYDMISGTGDFASIRTTLAECTGWYNVQPEYIGW